MCRSSIWASCIDRRSDDVTKKRKERRGEAQQEREKRAQTDGDEQRGQEADCRARQGFISTSVKG